MKNRVLLISLAVILILSVGLIGCGGEETPELTEYNLTISSTDGGSVTDPGEGTFTYDEGEVVDLEADADEGYQFISWSGDVDDITDVEDATTVITMNNNYSITASFTLIPLCRKYDLVISSTVGGEVITPGEGSLTCDEGETVNLVADAYEGYQFLSWTGDVGTIVHLNDATTTIRMNGNYEITANFAVVGILKIWNWYDLDAIRDRLSGSYVLMNNLDSTAAGYTVLAGLTANGGKGWEPIGTPYEGFTGSFNGRGYEICDLFINRPDEDEVGLFGTTHQGGSIEDVGVVNADVTGDTSVGCLAGISWGTVSNCYSTGKVSGDWSIGGLIGSSSGPVSNSCFTGCVTAVQYVGGLVGWGWDVSNSYSVGHVTGEFCVGALVGQTHFQSTLSNCYSTSNVTGKSTVGGLVGGNHFSAVSSSYSVGRVTGEEDTGGLVGSSNGITSNSFWDIQTSGQSTSADGVGKTTAEMKNMSTFTSWDIVAVANPDLRNTSYIWNIVDGQTYPFLSWEPVS